MWKGFPKKVQEIPVYEENKAPADSLHYKKMKPCIHPGRNEND